MGRRQLIAVIGGNVSTATDDDLIIAEELGCALVDAGFRVLTGGLGGVMEAASRGARTSQNYREGDVIGVIPGLNKEASPHCDIVIATGMHYARNQVIVASADAVVAIGGGAGTLSEIAFSWQLGKPIYAFQSKVGWSGKLGGSAIDDRPRKPITKVATVPELIELLGRNPER